MNPTAKVGVRPLGILLPEGTPEAPIDTDKPRLKLAEWIVDPANPLTARVMVNRIWQYHFGRGIVSTPNDFGRMGTRPSHPELLDWLATRFVEGGWKIKPIHRMILLSSAYRQSSLSPIEKAAAEEDSDDALLWKFNHRRLEAEEIRDAMLAVSGRLNLKQGGPSFLVPIDPELVLMLKRPQYWVATRDKSEYDRRTLYMIYKRNLRLPVRGGLRRARYAAFLRAPRAIHARSAGARAVERPDLQRAGRGVRRAPPEGALDTRRENRLRLAPGHRPLADRRRKSAGHEIPGDGRVL